MPPVSPLVATPDWPPHRTKNSMYVYKITTLLVKDHDLQPYLINLEKQTNIGDMKQNSQKL